MPRAAPRDQPPRRWACTAVPEPQPRPVHEAKRGPPRCPVAGHKAMPSRGHGQHRGDEEERQELGRRQTYCTCWLIAHRSRTGSQATRRLRGLRRHPASRSAVLPHARPIPRRVLGGSPECYRTARLRWGTASSSPRGLGQPLRRPRESDCSVAWRRRESAAAGAGARYQMRSMPPPLG
jgi:hypothetical protein